QGATVLSVVGGKANASATIDGFTVATLANALAAGKFADRLALAGSDDTVGAINTAFVADGYAIDIAAGAEIAQPVELQNVHAGGQVHSRFIVNAGEGAKAVIV